MNYTIKNDILEVTISTRGAELMSIKKDDIEYLWQGDPAYWTGRAYNLFPICGRLLEGKYTYKGDTYEMSSHGFARGMELTVEKQSESNIVFVLRTNEATKKSYPFDFEYSVEYTLCDNTLITKYTAKNNGENTMYYAFGGHPGFNVPFGNDGEFTDYYMEFSKNSDAKILVHNGVFMTKDTVPFEMVNGKRIDLRHDLFDNDAIFITDMDDEITLKSDKSDHSVTMKFADFKHLGFWHAPKTDAPYICIEPWQSVPSYYNKIDDMETKRDMTALAKGQASSAKFSITIK